MGRAGSTDLANNAKERGVVAAEGTMNRGAPFPVLLIGTLSFNSLIGFY